MKTQDYVMAGGIVVAAVAAVYLINHFMGNALVAKNAQGQLA